MNAQTNPAPRISPLLAKMIAQKTNREQVADIKVPGLNQKEDDIANRIAAAVLDKGLAIDKANAFDERVTDDSTSLQERLAEGESPYGEDGDYDSYGYESRDRDDERDSVSQRIGRAIEIPPALDSGLYDSSISLDDSQIAAVDSLLGEQYGCLIGAAGTGKTTVTKYLIHKLIYEQGFEVKMLDGDQGLNIAIITFTGMAAQVAKSNQPKWMQGACKTIHGLLEFKPEVIRSPKTGMEVRMFMPSRHNMNKLDHEVIFIDEASMVGLDLWKQLIAACKPGTRIYMIGDLNQLPPIIGQPIFAYALSAWPVSELTHVHRQKEEGANRIVDVAHQILNGKTPTFDVTKGNLGWRVCGFVLDDNPAKARLQIINILNQLRKTQIDSSVDPETPFVYDAYRDRVMTAGNGYDENDTSSMVQQFPLNQDLANLIQPANDEHPRIAIDAGRAKKVFSIDLRVMATKNEPPNALNRVTNGMTGVITDIVANQRYTGDKKLYGNLVDVEAEMRTRVSNLMAGNGGLKSFSEQVFDLESDDDMDLSFDATSPMEDLPENEDESAGGGMASHEVTVAFANGAIRTFRNKAAVESLELAYASTVAKCQGSQFDTAIIIVHHAQKGQLSREWLYTAITRAQKRVVVLHTRYGLAHSLSKQKITGRSLAEKIERYRAMMNEGIKINSLLGGNYKVNVPLSIEDYRA